MEYSVRFVDERSIYFKYNNIVYPTVYYITLGTICRFMTNQIQLSKKYACSILISHLIVRLQQLKFFGVELLLLYQLCLSYSKTINRRKALFYLITNVFILLQTVVSLEFIRSQTSVQVMIYNKRACYIKNIHFLLQIK